MRIASPQDLRMKPGDLTGGREKWREGGTGRCVIAIRMSRYMKLALGRCAVHVAIASLGLLDGHRVLKLWWWVAIR